MFRKYFLPQEANKRLPLVKKIVADILEKGKALRSLMEKSQSPAALRECQALQNEIEDLMKELEQIGCFYKDWNFEVGLVDFPARINEQEVFLCWRSDEKNIRWYHGLEDGFVGRKLIPEDWLDA